MKRWFNHLTLRTQLAAVAAGITLLLACTIVPTGGVLADTLSPSWLILALLLLTWASMTAILLPGERRVRVALNRVRRRLMRIRTGKRFRGRIKAPSRELELLHQSCARLEADWRRQSQVSQRKLDRERRKVARARRLLSFAHTVQSAGVAEQVYDALVRHLREQLHLQAVALFSVKDPIEGIQLRGCWPEDQIDAAELTTVEPNLCPCFRQNMPRGLDGCDRSLPCSIDRVVGSKDGLPAWCLPIHLTGGERVLVHMVLPEGKTWSNPRRQLATRYVNTAGSALVLLGLLSEAQRQGMTDALTGLYSRRSMDTLLQREVALADRHNQPLSFVMIDLDEFKTINDTSGHAAGDHILKALGDCIRMTLRRTDLAFRIGGDEFVIALPQTHIAQAQQVVNKLNQAFAAVDFSHAITNLQLQPTLSIGIAERDTAMGITALPGLLAAADAALYKSKETRNCVSLYQSNAA